MVGAPGPVGNDCTAASATPWRLVKNSGGAKIDVVEFSVPPEGTANACTAQVLPPSCVTNRNGGTRVMPPPLELAGVIPPLHETLENTDPPKRPPLVSLM